MKIPIEWLGGKTILSVAEVKKLDPGTEVWIHPMSERASYLEMFKRWGW